MRPDDSSFRLPEREKTEAVFAAGRESFAYGETGDEDDMRRGALSEERLWKRQ